MKKIGNLILPAFIFVLTCSFAFGGDDTTALEGKVYKVTMTLMKNGKAGKPSQEEITFKGGKFKSKLIDKEMGAPAIPVEFIVDSTFFENEEDLPYVEFEGEFVNKLEELVKVTGTVDGYGIEGNVSLSKKDKEKRRYDFVGSLKERKKK